MLENDRNGVKKITESINYAGILPVFLPMNFKNVGDADLFIRPGSVQKNSAEIELFLKKAVNSSRFDRNIGKSIEERYPRFALKLPMLDGSSSLQNRTTTANILYGQNESKIQLIRQIASIITKRTRNRAIKEKLVRGVETIRSKRAVAMMSTVTLATVTATISPETILTTAITTMVTTVIATPTLTMVITTVTPVTVTNITVIRPTATVFQ